LEEKVKLKQRFGFLGYEVSSKALPLNDLFVPLPLLPESTILTAICLCVNRTTQKVVIGGFS